MLNTLDQDGVLVIELDHGKVNALDSELLLAITSAVQHAEAHRPIVVTGAGRAFSAGVDLRRIVDGGPAYTEEFLDALSRCFLAIFDHPGPMVAAVNGAAIAGGCVIAAACDVRVLSAGPIGLAELAVGVPFPTAALEIVRGVVGSRTRELVLSAAKLDGEQALATGLIDQITTAETLLPTAVDRARALAALPTGVHAHTKRQLQQPVRERISARAADEDRAMTALWASPDVRSAVAAYLDRLTTKRVAP